MQSQEACSTAKEREAQTAEDFDTEGQAEQQVRRKTQIALLQLLLFYRSAASDNNPAMRMIEEMERQGRPVHPRLRKMAELMDEMNEDPGLLKPGDASMAAPFTAKQASVMPCTDLIMQGRSTLVSTVQMFKILGLMSLANAYALSVMRLQGVKTGDVQVKAFRHNPSTIVFARRSRFLEY